MSGSIAETVEVAGRAGLVSHLRKQWESWPGVEFADSQVNVSPYGGDDDRCGWKDVHIVVIDGMGVQGFCEGPPDMVVAA